MYNPVFADYFDIIAIALLVIVVGVVSAWGNWARKKEAKERAKEKERKKLIALLNATNDNIILNMEAITAAHQLHDVYEGQIVEEAEEWRKS